jgi:hypothetical protein
MDMLTLESPTIIAAIVIVVLSVQGFGLIMPTEIRVFFELRKKELNQPGQDNSMSMRNVKLAGSQGVFQVAPIFVMANLALGFV